MASSSASFTITYPKIGDIDFFPQALPHVVILSEWVVKSIWGGLRSPLGRSLLDLGSPVDLCGDQKT